MIDSITITIKPLTKAQIEKARGHHVWGFCRQDNFNKFYIAYDKEMGTLDIILTLFHEFSHVICGLFATHYGRKNKAEETYCDAIGLYGKLMYKWYCDESEQH